MRDTIVIYKDPETEAVQLDFPIPLNGIRKLEPQIDNLNKYIIPFSKMNQEQKAYYIFWDNGTRERIKGIIEGNGAGRRSVLKWLVELRIKQVLLKTAFQYKLVVISSQDEWNKIQEKRKEHARMCEES